MRITVACDQSVAELQYSKNTKFSPQHATVCLVYSSILAAACVSSLNLLVLDHIYCYDRITFFTK